MVPMTLVFRGSHVLGSFPLTEGPNLGQSIKRLLFKAFCSTAAPDLCCLHGIPVQLG